MAAKMFSLASCGKLPTPWCNFYIGSQEFPVMLFYDILITFGESTGKLRVLYYVFIVCRGRGREYLEEEIHVRYCAMGNGEFS